MSLQDRTFAMMHIYVTSLLTKFILLPFLLNLYVQFDKS
jgi:hypothetical protein